MKEGEQQHFQKTEKRRNFKNPPLHTHAYKQTKMSFPVYLLMTPSKERNKELYSKMLKLRKTPLDYTYGNYLQ